MDEQVFIYDSTENGISFGYLFVIFILSLIPVNSFAAEKLSYYSDYFSFVGRDSTGYVAFALDNNRGVDGSDYQAEHFGVLYDQKAGWIKLIGTGKYDNTHGDLERIPDSSHFKFKGQLNDGFIIQSKDNFLTLKTESIIVQMSESEGKRSQSWGVAKATLVWKGREIPGRLIYEGLVHHGWNRLTRTYTDTWDNFQGFYLTLDLGSPNTWRDLYLRSEGDAKNQRTKGFATPDDWSGLIQTSRFTAFDKAYNLGFYRWPQSWDIELKLRGSKDFSPRKLTLLQVSRKNQGNWIVGGFAMTVVEGELIKNGKAIPVVGFVELIK